MRSSDVADVQVRVGLGRVDPGVAEDRLDVAQVRAGSEKMRGEAVTERVRRDRAPDPGFLARDRDTVLDAATEKTTARVARAGACEKERSLASSPDESRPCLLDVEPQDLGRVLAERDEAVLSAFARPHEDGPAREIDVRDVESLNLGSPEA